MKPKTRIENFLAKIAGNPDAKEMEPETRMEYFLNDIVIPSGGGDTETASVFYVTFTSSTSPSAGQVWRADKTFAEVEAAYNKNMPVVAKMMSGEQVLIYQLRSCTPGNTFVFNTPIDVASNQIDLYNIIFMSDGTINRIKMTYPNA